MRKHIYSYISLILVIINLEMIIKYYRLLKSMNIKI